MAANSTVTSGFEAKGTIRWRKETIGALLLTCSPSGMDEPVRIGRLP